MSLLLNWVVYILRCRDGSFYTGATNDLEKRVKAHNLGKGADYTRSKLPVTVAAVIRGLSRSAALKTEASIKKMSHKQKFQLVKNICKENWMKQSVARRPDIGKKGGGT